MKFIIRISGRSSPESHSRKKNVSYLNESSTQLKHHKKCNGAEKYRRGTNGAKRVREIKENEVLVIETKASRKEPAPLGGVKGNALFVVKK